MSSDSESEPDTSPLPESIIDSLLSSVAVADPSLVCAVCTNSFGSASEPEPDTATALPCGHVYHAGCILPWLRRRNSCPLCRCPLLLRRRRRGPRVDVEDAERVMAVARELSEVSPGAAEAVATVHALLAMVRGRPEEGGGRRAAASSSS